MCEKKEKVEEKKSKYVFYSYWKNRPKVVGDKLSQEPCELFEVDVTPPPSRKEQCLRAFAVGEITTGGSSIGAISEQDFVQVDDVEAFETYLDECEDMGDCVRNYNKFLMKKYKADSELVEARKKYQAQEEENRKKYEEWLKSQKPEEPKKDN